MTDPNTETGMKDIRGRPVFQDDDPDVVYVIGFDGQRVNIERTSGKTTYVQPMRFPVTSSKETRAGIRDESLARLIRSMNLDGYSPDNPDVKWTLCLRGRKVLNEGPGSHFDARFYGPTIETYLCADVQVIDQQTVANATDRSGEPG